MYFNILPAIKYDVKPIGYPFSESDFVVAKNFFRRYKVSDTAFSQTVYYQKVAVADGDRLEQIADKLYGNPFYDWVIALTNNMINPLFDLPMSENELRKHIESQYDNPYYDTHHYEIISDEKQIELFGKVLIQGETWVDETFYNNQARYTASPFPNLTPDTQTIPVRKEYIFTDPNLLNTLDNNLIQYTYGSEFTAFGTGSGNDGGFVIYPPIKGTVRSSGYLRFRGAPDDARWALLNPIDATYYDKITLYGSFGNNLNGGEWPDVLPNPPGVSGEVLTIQYRRNINENWIDMGIIIHIGVAQGVFAPTDQQLPDPETGASGRPPGVYENLTVYDTSYNPTPMRVTITVNDNYEVSNVEILDRGYGLSNGQSYIILNDDLGGGIAGIVGGIEVPLLDYQFSVYIYNEFGIDGPQYGRYDTVPNNFSLPIPPEARTSSTEFRIYQPDNTGTTFDQYGISAIYFTGSITTELPLGFEWTKIDDDHYVIDGQDWNRIDGQWYIKTEQGYQYWNGNSIDEVSGSILARPVTEFEYEQTENEKKREIYILKPQYIDPFVEEFKKASLYKKSSDFVSNRLKKTGV